MSERLFLAGQQWQIDIWKKMFGDSVDYIVTTPLPTTPDNKTGEGE